MLERQTEKATASMAAVKGQETAGASSAGSDERYDSRNKKVKKSPKKKEYIGTAGDNDTSAQQLINNVESEEAFQVR